MPPTIAVHGGIKFLGPDPAVENLELQHLDTDPSNPGPGRIWHNTADYRVKYAEGKNGNNGSITVRYFLHDGDLPQFNGKMKQYYSNGVPQSLGTSVIPYGNTAPTATQGTLLWSKAITPTALDAIIEIQFDGMVDVSAQNANVTLTLFRDGQLIGLIGVSSSKSGYDFVTPFILRAIDTPNTLNPVTYTCRIGVSSGTWYLGRGQNATYGGVNKCTWSIKEF